MPAFVDTRYPAQGIADRLFSRPPRKPYCQSKRPAKAPPSVQIARDLLRTEVAQQIAQIQELRALAKAQGCLIYLRDLDAGTLKSREGDVLASGSVRALIASLKAGT